MHPCVVLLPGYRSRMTVQIPVDEKWLLAVGFEPAQAEHEFRLLLAAKLYEVRRLTLAQAAEMAGMSLWTFGEELGRLGVSVLNLSPEQLAHDIRSA